MLPETLISKRELLAGMAMQALVNAGETAYHSQKTGDPTLYAIDYAASAVKFADALIAALDQKA